MLAADWARYPDLHADALRAALGRRFDWPADGVLLGNGSNELLAMALAALAGGGRQVLLAQPSFGLYRTLIASAGARALEIGPRADLALPLAELEAAIARDPTRPVLLCTPNNPTGEAIAPQRLATIAERLAAPLLVDSAYGEFSRHDYRPVLARFPHVVLFGTFSKAWSLAGLRLGYLLADPRLVAELAKAKLPYNLGRAAAIAGEVTLAESAALARRVRAIVARRPRFAALLAAAGAEVLPSAANFVLARFGERASELARRLAARGVRLRDLGAGPGLGGCLRVSIGDGRAERALARALAAERGAFALPPAGATYAPRRAR